MSSMWSRPDPNHDDLSSSSSSTPNLSRSPSRGSIRAIIPPNAFTHPQALVANQMATNNKPPTRISSIAKSIDSVLDAPASAHNSPPPRLNRPTVKLRPSWIGPPRVERPPTPGIQAMKQPITIDFASPGLTPPVYISTNMSEPAWEPLKMHGAKHSSNGSWRFYKSFEVDEGEYQYKFRLGEGDWWECDTAKPLVDDGYGNKNNLVVVKPYEKKLENPPLPSSSPAALPIQPATAKVFESAVPKAPALLMPPQSAYLTQPVETPAVETPHPLFPSPNVPLLKHEKLEDQSASSEHTPEAEEPGSGVYGLSDDADAEEGPGSAKKEADNEEEDQSSSSSSSSSSSYEETDAYETPLLPHEQVTPASQTKSSKATPGTAASHLSTAAQKESASQPLLPHEQLTPTTPSQAPKANTRAPASNSSTSAKVDSNPQPPLLPHEQLTPISTTQASKTNAKSKPKTIPSDVPSPYKPHLHPVIPQEADPNDSSLEQFPKDYAGIVSLMRRLSRPENNNNNASSISHNYRDPHDVAMASQASTESFGSSLSLPSVPESEAETDEDDEERLEQIRESGEEDAEDEDRYFPITEPEDADSGPRDVSATPHPKAGPAMEKIRRRVVAELNESERREGKTKKEGKKIRAEPEDRVVAFLGGRDRAVAVVAGLLVVAVGFAAARYGDELLHLAG